VEQLEEAARATDDLVVQLHGSQQQLQALQQLLQAAPSPDTVAALEQDKAALQQQLQALQQQLQAARSTESGGVAGPLLLLLAYADVC
jgi:hypothetical protein